MERFTTTRAWFLLVRKVTASMGWKGLPYDRCPGSLRITAINQLASTKERFTTTRAYCLLAKKTIALGSSMGWTGLACTPGLRAQGSLESKTFCWLESIQSQSLGHTIRARAMTPWKKMATTSWRMFLSSHSINSRLTPALIGMADESSSRFAELLCSYLAPSTADWKRLPRIDLRPLALWPKTVPIVSHSTP